MRPDLRQSIKIVHLLLLRSRDGIGLRIPTPTLHSRILIVENHEIVAEGLKQLLEPEFGIAGIVKNGANFVRPALVLKPDLILCNVSMSSLDALKAAERERKPFLT
jgi:PleD family two-component response regulator